MPFVETLLNFLTPRREPTVTAEQLREMAQSRRFQEVVDLFKSGQVVPDPSAYAQVGYCYHQLLNHEEAIVHLKKALAFWPADYYSSLFLGLSYKALERKPEALAQFLSTLRIHPKQTGDILPHLLPLVAGLADAEERKRIFEQIQIDPSSPHFTQVAFHQGKDGGPTFRKFYSAKELAQSGHVTLRPAGETERLRVIDLAGAPDIWVEVCSPYVAEVPDAQILSGSSLVLVGKDRVLSDTLANREYGQYANMQYDSMVTARREDALLVKAFEPDAEIPEAIMLCGLASGAFGHWTAEFLPKLRFFEKHPRFAEIPILIDEGMPQAHYDYLAALVSNHTIRLAKGKSLLVKNLLVAPTDTFFPADLVENHKVPVERQSNLTIGALRYLGQKIRARFGEPSSPSTKIFLSRRKSQWRRLVEEEAIIAELKNLGFETVYTEDFSFEKQVEIFKNAQFIVAPNGSALNNLVFSNPSVKVLLLGQKNFFNWGGWFGSFREVGYDPQYLAGDLVGDKRQKHLDYSIPLTAVLTRVNEMLG